MDRENQIEMGEENTMRRLRVEGPESLAELVALYKTETNRHIRQRLQVVMFVKEGRLGTEVAALLNLLCGNGSEVCPSVQPKWCRRSASAL